MKTISNPMKFILTMLLVLVFIPVFLVIFTSKARGAFILSNPTYVTVTTNSAVVATSYATINIPSLSVQVTGVTNINTVSTNWICAYVGTNVVQVTNWVYRASDVGNTNTWVTNFQNLNYQVPVGWLLQSQPQNGGTNTYFIQGQ